MKERRRWLVVAGLFISLTLLPVLGWAYDELEVSITASATSGAPGLEVDFEASASGGYLDSYSYEWSGDVSGDDYDTSEVFEDEGMYEATVTVTCGDQTATETVEVEICTPLSITSISASPTWDRVPTQVTFEVSVSGGTGSYDYEWDGIVSGSSSTETETFNEGDDGTYTAWVTVTSGSQTVVSSEVEVTIEVSAADFIDDSLDIMPEEGDDACDAIVDAETTIEFGELEHHAQYDPATNTITINEAYLTASEEFLATLIAHEGTHVLYRNEPYCSHEEYLAFKATADVAIALGVDSDAIDVIYDEYGNLRDEEDAVYILINDYGYEF
jgi:hypothetical protein